MVFEVARKKLLLMWLHPPVREAFFVGLVYVSIQYLFRIIFHMALLDRVVSQFLGDLPRSVKGQNGVEFDFQFS